jgi:hypothetical protein
MWKVAVSRPWGEGQVLPEEQGRADHQRHTIAAVLSDYTGNIILG